MAYTINQVQLLGRLTAHPQEGATPQDLTAYTRFTLAINNGKDAEGNDRPADYVSIIAWRKLGEYAADNLEKGQRCFVSGKIKTSSYVKDGERKYVTDVVAAQIIPLDKPKGQTGDPDVSADIPPGFYQIANDDIPF